MRKDVLKITMKRNGEYANYGIQLLEDMDEEELFGMFESILEWIRSNERLSKVYTIAQLHFIEERMGKSVGELLDEGLIGEEPNAFS